MVAGVIANVAWLDDDSFSIFDELKVTRFLIFKLSMPLRISSISLSTSSMIGM